MSWFRYVIIVPTKNLDETISGLGDFVYKVIGERKRHSIIACEGRYLVDIDEDRDYLAAIDGRNCWWYSIGNEEKAKIFDISIIVTIGFIVELSNKSSILNQSKIKKLIKLFRASNEGDELTEYEKWGFRFYYDIRADRLEHNQINAALISLGTILEECDVPYYVACTYENCGDTLGDLDPELLFIGPDAIVKSKRAKGATKRDRLDLVINDGQILLDGNGIPELEEAYR